MNTCLHYEPKTKKSLAFQQNTLGKLKDCTQLGLILYFQGKTLVPRSKALFENPCGFQAGFLAHGSFYSPPLPGPIQRTSGISWLSFPFTAAGPRRFRTVFPFKFSEYLNP
jgi:hypothetical protein